MIMPNKLTKAFAALGLLCGLFLFATSLDDPAYLLIWYSVIIAVCGYALIKKPYNPDDDDNLK